MDDQGTRDELTGRSKPVGTYAGAASPQEATAVGEPVDVAPGTGGGTPGTSSLDATMARTFAGQSEEQAGARARPGETAGQGAGGGGGPMAKVDAGIEKAAEGIDKLVGAIRHQGEELGHSAGATGRVGSAAVATADRLEGASRYLHQTDADHLMTDLEALVRRRPAESLLAVAGIGFLLAKALR